MINGMPIFYNSKIGRGLEPVQTKKGKGLEPVQTKRELVTKDVIKNELMEMV